FLVQSRVYAINLLFATVVLAAVPKSHRWSPGPGRSSLRRTEAPPVHGPTPGRSPPAAFVHPRAGPDNHPFCPPAPRPPNISPPAPGFSPSAPPTVSGGSPYSHKPSPSLTDETP